MVAAMDGERLAGATRAALPCIPMKKEKEPAPRRGPVLLHESLGSRLVAVPHPG